MSFVGSGKSDTIVAECVVVLRQLLQQNASSAQNSVCVKTLRQLAKLLIVKNGIESEPVARSSVVWLVGEFQHLLDGAAPDILRILAAGFIGALALLTVRTHYSDCRV